MKKVTILLTLLVIALSSYSQITGKVVKVSDGDTFTLLDANNKQHRVRLDGIDCPENKQDYGEKARQFTASLIAGKNITVDNSNMDRYGRILAFVIVDGKNVNEELLKNGLAWHYKQYNKSSRLAQLEDEARKKKINIWSVPNAVAPWDFRNGKKTTTNNVKTSSTTSSKKSSSQSGYCGAPTKKGGSCKRKVSGGGRCWQH